VTYFGQACTLIEAAGRKILTDPWLTEGAYFGTWFHTHLLADAGVAPETFPKDVDYLFISHEHQDHLDPATLRHFPHDIPVLICKFPTSKFRCHLEALGLTNIHELSSGEPLGLGDDDLRLTIFGTAEYTNDSALLVEAEGFTVFNETDCKLGYADLARLGERKIDIGFYMFSGANWYPMMYDYPEPVMLENVRRRRRALLKSLVQRVKLTKPRIAVPAAGPCTVLDPERLWLNSPDRGIFIDPEEGVRALRAADVTAEPVSLVATDRWDSGSGVERQAPPGFRLPREEYIAGAARRMESRIAVAREAEPAAGRDLPQRMTSYFEAAVRALTPTVRERIDAALALVVTGPCGGCWTMDFKAARPPYVQDRIAPGWTYRIEVEDKLIYPFLTGREIFFEHILLSLRARCARRPDEYNEPLYHFLYEHDPVKLHYWYATH
jgi:hypothetical protein